MNRSVFEQNQKINRSLVYPIAKSYRDTVPEPVRDSIDAFTANLNEPFVFANNILQLRFSAASTTLGRFLLNSTFGIGGLVDIASKEGLPHQTGDFGQTLYVWGIRESDYLVVPLLGPTNVRDAFGSGVELGAQVFVGTVLPESAATAANGVGVAGTVTSPIASLSKVEDMEELERSSIDFYIMLRSVTQQKREAELRDALKESLLSKLLGAEDDSPGAPGDSPDTPVLSSPALEEPPPVAPPGPEAQSKTPATKPPGPG